MVAHAFGMAKPAQLAMNETMFHAQQAARAVGDESRGFVDASSTGTGIRKRMAPKTRMADVPTSIDVAPHILVATIVKELVTS